MRTGTEGHGFLGVPAGIVTIRFIEIALSSRLAEPNMKKIALFRFERHATEFV